MIFSVRSRLKILIYLGAAVLFVAGLFTSGPSVAGITIGRLSIVEAVLFTILASFDRWLWTLPGVVGVLRTGPVLKGTWKGTAHSTYDDQERVIYIAIRQSFTEIAVRLMSKESFSESTSCQLVRKPDGLSIVEYSYSNEPKQTIRHRSAIHLGAARLQCTGLRPNRLEGEYWTDRKTTGDLEFTARSKKVLQTFADAEAHFGATGVE